MSRDLSKLFDDVTGKLGRITMEDAETIKASTELSDKVAKLRASIARLPHPEQK